MTATTEASLSFDRTIDPRLVWVVAPEQAFVTDWHYDPDAEQLTVANRLPRSHLRYSDTANPYPDIPMLAQLASQAGVIVVSEMLDVPLESTFLLRRVTVTLDPLEHNVIGREATRYTVTTDAERCSFKVRRTGRPPTGSMIAGCELDGRPSGTLEIQGIWVTDEMFQFFRRAGGAPEKQDWPRDEEPELLTGRSHPRNQAIAPLRPGDAPQTYVTTVLVDEDDPTFFERPLDHVPGLLMLDAAKQATIAATCRERTVDPSSVAVDYAEFTFSRFAELYAPVECRVDFSHGLREITSECAQGGRTVCQARLKVAVLDE